MSALHVFAVLAACAAATPSRSAPSATATGVAPPAMMIAGGATALRATPSATGRLRFRLPYGTPVDVIGRPAPGWVQVRLPTVPPEEGFVAERLVVVRSTTPSANDVAWIASAKHEHCCTAEQVATVAAPTCVMCGVYMGPGENEFASVCGMDPQARDTPTGTQQECIDMANKRQADETREQAERALFWQPSAALDDRLRVWARLLDGGVYEDVPVHVLAASPLLRMPATGRALPGAIERTADGEEPYPWNKDARARVRGCVTLPDAPARSPFHASAASKRRIEASLLREANGALRIGEPDGAHQSTQLGRVLDTFENGARFALDARRRLVSPPVAALLLSPKQVRAARAPVSIDAAGLAFDAPIAAAPPRLAVWIGGDGQVALRGDGAARDLSARVRSDEACAGVRAFGYDVDDDGAVDLVWSSWSTDEDVGADEPIEMHELSIAVDQRWRGLSVDVLAAPGGC